jgi:hypothetical protein
MDLEAELDRLFQAPLTEFTEARNALAASLRSHDAAAADRVKSLAKPAASAWAVNQLSFRDPEVLSALVAAGARLRATQQGALSAADLREAMSVWRAALTAAVKRAGSYLGKAPSPALVQRIQGTLQALGLREPANADPRAGRLTADLDPPGFDALDGLLPGPGTAPSTPGAAGNDSAVDAARRRFELARAEAEASRRRSRAAEAEAETAAAERRLEGARAELAEAERRLAHARELVAREQEGLTRVRSQLDEARTALADAEAALRRMQDVGS